MYRCLSKSEFAADKVRDFDFGIDFDSILLALNVQLKRKLCPCALCDTKIVSMYQYIQLINWRERVWGGGSQSFQNLFFLYKN